MSFDESQEENLSLDQIELKSISLVFDDMPLFKAPPLSDFAVQDFGPIKLIGTIPGKEILSPRLWNLPEVFRKRLQAFSDNSSHEMNRQNRMVDLVRYNFNNGVQISLKDVLRHPYHRRIPGDLMPGSKTEVSVFSKWPLNQQSEKIFVSQSLVEVETIMQNLLAHIGDWQSKNKIEVYLQTKQNLNQALRIQEINFNAQAELSWRTDFNEKENNVVETELRLIPKDKRVLYYYDSFALNPAEGKLIVHPWLREFSLLQEVLSSLNLDLSVSFKDHPAVDLQNEIEAKKVISYLKKRTLSLDFLGVSEKIPKEKIQTQIRLNESGFFYIQHVAQKKNKENFTRQNWSTQSVAMLQTLSRGITFLLKSEPKEMASRSLHKREWDLKILKHLGILQYIFFEALSYHFDGQLSDGRIVLPSEIFKLIQPRIKSLLTAGADTLLIRDLTLPDICSGSVLSCFEDFLHVTLKSITGNETFYSSEGEIELEALTEKEFRLIYELLKSEIQSTGGETFKKSKTPFLSRIWNGNFEEDAFLRFGLYFFPLKGSDDQTRVHRAIESLQSLIPFQYSLYYKDQPLQELGEEDFQVDFVLETSRDERMFNWFELNPQFFLFGKEVDPDHFLSLGGGGVVEYKGRLYLVPKKQMPSLRRLENFWQKLQAGKTETLKKNGLEKIYKLPKHQTLELLALRASGVRIRGNEEWQAICEFYDNLGGHQKNELPLPNSTKDILKDYQKIGVQWLNDLYQLRFGALLADDMGLGKTLQALTFLEMLRLKKELGRILIVVPSSLIYNWLSEIQKFTPGLPTFIFSNKDKESIGKRLELNEDSVVIATYGLLMEHESFLAQYKWQVLIFDEAQNLKNISTKRTSAARALTARFKIALTGTPMENHYGEFYSLVDLLVPGSLGRIEDFRKTFVNTELITREQMDDLKLKIKPLLLRRTKKEILDQLPEKQETKVSIAFEDRQKEIYRDIALSYNQRVHEVIGQKGESSVQLQMLTALLRLRQACSDPAALPNVKYDKTPPKLEALLDSIEEIVESGESALVFTQFLQTLERTANLLQAQGIPVYVLHGGVPTKKRQEILADFNANKKGAVLAMTLKTGGVGLNLTKASYVFHIEPWWNPSVENQATDRAHRLGQSKAVQVFRYIMHESLEEKIELLKDRKDKKFQTLFTSAESDLALDASGSALSREDFDFLLGLSQLKK